MRMRGGDGPLVLAAGLAVVAAVVVAVAGVRAGLVVLCVAVGAGLLALARVATVVLRRVDHLTAVAHTTRKQTAGNRRAQRRQRQRIAALQQRQTQLVVAVRDASGQVEVVRKQVNQARAQAVRDATRTLAGVDSVASDTVRITRLTQRLAPGTGSLPGLGGWAVPPATLLAMVEEVEQRSGPVVVVECGSGSSTLFLALTLARRGEGGHVVALESDASFAEETRGHLRRHGVDGLATVVDAPLVPTDLPDGSSQPWFDLSGLPDTGPVDMLFVDGPVRPTARLARYPALPCLGDRLVPGACIVLDDTHRPEEQETLRRWVDEDGGPDVVVERANAWSTILRVR